jgi:hypothetical protein
MKKLTLIFLLISLNLFAQTNKINIKLNDSISLTLEKSDFVLTDQKVDYYKNFPIGINGKIIFGTDGDLPKSKLTKAELKIGEKNYLLEIDGMFNPWFGNGVNENLFRLEIHYGEIKLGGIFSDGAGSYGAEWIIFKNSSIRTILSKDEDIIIGYFQN